MNGSLCYSIVKILISLILDDAKGMVANKKRFIEEYSGDTLFMPKTNPKPEDYMATFAGNIDDNFKLGISLTKKSVKVLVHLYYFRKLSLAERLLTLLFSHVFSFTLTFTLPTSSLLLLWDFE